MSTQIKENIYYKTIYLKDRYVSVMLSQAKTVDAKRFGKKL
jgi:hypothetical protein